MRINRVELIDHLNAVINDRNEDYAARCIAADDKVRQAEAGYVVKTEGAWREFARRVLAEVEHGHAVTKKVVPEALTTRSGWIDFFEAPDARVASPNTGELRRLVKLLQVSPDETVSLASLERAGFVLGKVLR